MINPIKLGLPKTIRIISLVLRFVDKMKMRSDNFDVRAVEPRALLNYVDTNFIGMQVKGNDSLHTANWKKSLQTARVALDSPTRRVEPTTLNAF